MKRVVFARIVALASVSLPLFAAGMMACSSDLFHATDWQSACDKNPETAGCPGADPPTTSTSISATSAESATSAQATTSGSGGAGGAGACSEAGSCAQCEACALAGPCATEAAECDQNPECALLLDCYLSCAPGDQACADQCVTTHSGGVGEAGALYLCVECNACAPMCDAAMLCG